MARVAIAEDHQVVRDGLRRILESKGHEIVAEVGDGLKVVDEVETSTPDILLLDLGLPNLHGLDVLRQLQQRHAQTRVLVLSAERRDDFVIGALKQGARGYLLKSASARELLAAVDAITAGGRYVDTELSDALVRGIGDGTAAAGDPYEALSARELQVFHAMAEGLSNTAIGERLFISPRTVESHRSKIMRQLGLKTQTDTVLYALRRGLIKLEG
jgi:DNA-binding NarL/FixJ family response regulator